MIHCFNVVLRSVSSSGSDVVSMLPHVENPRSDFVSISMSDQRYLDVDPLRWKKYDPTLKGWLGRILALKDSV